MSSTPITELVSRFKARTLGYFFVLFNANLDKLAKHRYIFAGNTTKMIKTPGQILVSVQSNATVSSVDLGNPSVGKDNYDSPLFPKKFLSLFFHGPLHADVLPTKLQNKHRQEQFRDFCINY